MDNIRERDVESYLKNRVESLGLGYHKFIPDYRNGMPDRLITLPNRTCVWVELKCEHGTLSGLQLLRHKELRDQGQQVAVVWNKEQADKLVASLSEDVMGRA